MTIRRQQNVIERLINDKVIAIYNLEGWERRKIVPFEKDDEIQICFTKNSLYLLEGVFDNYLFFNGELIHDPWNLNKTV